MEKFNSWFVDDTFKCSSTLFTEIVMVHVLATNSLIPIVYALLLNKSQKTYVHFLNQSKNIISTLLPKLIMSDFEMASINAFKEIFPNLKQKGAISIFPNVFDVKYNKFNIWPPPNNIYNF